jgi:Flp pilus assembly pilin Flp
VIASTIHRVRIVRRRRTCLQWSCGTFGQAAKVFLVTRFPFERETNMRSLIRNKKGQGLVEYGLLIAGVALICAAAVSVFGHKTSDLIAAVATVLPGAHDDDNGPMVSGKLIETTDGAAAPIELDLVTIAVNSGTPRLGNNVTNTVGAAEDFGGLIVEPN